MNEKERGMSEEQGIAMQWLPEADENATTSFVWQPVADAGEGWVVLSLA